MATDPTSPDVNLSRGAPGAENPHQLPSAFSLFKPSWEGVKLNIGMLIILVAVPYILISMVTAAFAWTFSPSNLVNGGSGALVVFLANLIGILYFLLAGSAIVHVVLKSSVLEKASFASAWEVFKKFWWRFILLSLWVVFIVIIGFVCFIVPGVILLKRYFLSHYALIDQGLGIFDSMRKSNELSRDRSMSIYGIFGVHILINLPSALPVLGFASLALQAVYFCAPAVRYQQLKNSRPAVGPAKA